MIIRARYVLTMDGPPIRDGAVVVEGDRVGAVSCSGNVPDVDLGDAVLFPGLINAHCHLDYTGMLGQVPWRGDFRDWIVRITALKKQWTTEQYGASINRGLAELARTGTTSVVNIECFPKLVPPAALRAWWCVELLDLTWSEGSRRMVEDAARWLETQPRGGLAPHAPYTTTAPLYRLAARIARERGWLLTTHIAEARKEVPLAELGVLGPNCLLAHANHLDEAEVESVARSGASVVHCPRAHRFFQRDAPPWELWRRHGVNVCLGTDSLASNESLDMRAEMRTLTLMPAREALAMATVNAAKALNCEGKLGKIVVGGWADMAAVPLDGDPYESVVRSEKPVCFSMVGGKVVLQ
jgi:cytosine/adenosine deaminase-related metal-dependent hydrolase